MKACSTVVPLSATSIPPPAGSADPTRTMPSVPILTTVRHLRRADLSSAIAAFRRIPPPSAVSCPALHEALVLACAHVPDPAAASAALASAPAPTLAAFSHAAAAHARSGDAAGAVTVLEQLARTTLPIDVRIVSAVEKYVRASARALEVGKRRARERRTGALLMRVQTAGKAATEEPGLKGVSLDMSGFFVEGGGDVQEWIEKRNDEHERSLSLVPVGANPGKVSADGSQRAVGIARIRKAELDPDDPFAFKRCESVQLHSFHAVSQQSGVFSRMPIDVALRKASGSLGRVDALWDRIVETPSLYANPANLSAAVSAYLRCGWKGSIRSIDAVYHWLGAHAGGRVDQFRDTLRASPTRRSMLLTAATSALSASAPSAPRRALEVADALTALGLPEFEDSLPLSGALFKVLRCSHLPLEETLERLHAVRECFVQLDEQSFSLGLGAILESLASPTKRWAAGNAWLGIMRSAGVALTHHTYASLAGQLRFLNDPAITTSLLRDMARAGVDPTSRIYGTIFASCITHGKYTSSSRRRALPLSSMLSMLRAVQCHMTASGVSHSPFSRFSLACALAHLGAVDEAFREFSISVAAAAEDGRASALVCRDYNALISHFAHCRCATPDGPSAAFSVYDRMRQTEAVPTAKTLEHLLAACVRLGDHKRAVVYVGEVSDRARAAHASIVLEKAGIESLLVALEKCADSSSWKVCEALLCESLRTQEPAVSVSAIELTVLAYARRGHRVVCERIIAAAGVGDLADSCWELLLDGKGDFQRVRTARQRRRGLDFWECDKSLLIGPPNEAEGAIFGRNANSWNKDMPFSEDEPFFPHLN